MNRQWTKRVILVIFAFSVSFFVSFPSTVAKNVIPFYWNSINVNIDVQSNGDMWVTERQEYAFLADYSNRRYRYIPLDRVDAIKDVSVQENNQIILSNSPDRFRVRSSPKSAVI